MFSKDDFIKALNKAGFEQQKGKRSDGSKKSFYHTTYPMVRATFMDHKNAKDIADVEQKQLINLISFVVLLDCVNGKNFSREYLDTYLEVFDKAWKRTIKEKLSKVNLEKDDAIFQIMPSNLIIEMRRLLGNLDTNVVLNYFLGKGDLV